MSAYLTPGIYLRPKPAERKDIRLVRTDVAGFVGFAERGPLPLMDLSPPGGKFKAKDLAIRLTSWKEFTAVFGRFIPYGSLAYAVRAFFENGGTTCYVVRIAATNHPDSLLRPRIASMVIPDGSAPRLVAKLASPISKGATELVLDNASKLGEGHLVAVADADKGVSEFAMVIAVHENKITLGHKTLAPLSAGASVYRYSPALAVTATSAGNWGNRIRLDFTPLQDADVVDEFSLRVTVEGATDSSQPKEEEFYKRLSLTGILKKKGDSKNPLYAPDIINGQSQIIRVMASKASLPVGRGFSNKLAAGPIGAGSVYLDGGRDGLDHVGVADFAGGSDDYRGLRLLEEIDDVAILCAPDAVFAPPYKKSKLPLPKRNPCDPKPKPPAPDSVAEDPTAIPPAFAELTVLDIYQTMIAQCERLRDRVAILDSPREMRETSQLVDWRFQFKTRFAALYYPWLKVPDSLNPEGLTRAIPPSGHVAGAYARIDNQFGVHRPPANVALEFITDVAEEVTALHQEELNPFDVNAIRPFNGRGIRIWGARSLADKNDSAWRFIHARRLMSMIEESVYKSMQWTVFESNDFSLRRTLVHSLTVFLEAIWRQGGLKGALPAQGFYVKCDETNNPPSVTGPGQLVCEVGIAIAAPMEFIVFEIRQGRGLSEITEL
jgi:hypothetical protein